MKRTGIWVFVLGGIVYNDLFLSVLGIGTRPLGAGVALFALKYFLTLMVGVVLLHQPAARMDEPPAAKPSRWRVTPVGAGLLVLACWIGWVAVADIVLHKRVENMSSESAGYVQLFLVADLVLTLSRAIAVALATWLAGAVETAVIARWLDTVNGGGTNTASRRIAAVVVVAMALFVVRRETTVASPFAAPKPAERVKNQLELLTYDLQGHPRTVLCAARALPLQLDSVELAAMWASLAATDTVAGHSDTRALRSLIARPPDQAMPETPCTNFELAQGLMTDDWIDRPSYGQPPPPVIYDSVRAASVTLALAPQSRDAARGYACVRARAMRQLDSAQRKTMTDALARQESRLEPQRHKTFDTSVSAVPSDAIKDPACVPWTVAP